MFRDTSSAIRVSSKAIVAAPPVSSASPSIASVSSNGFGSIARSAFGCASARSCAGAADAADLRLLQQRTRARGGIAELAAKMNGERQHDQETDEARVDRRDGAEVEDAGRPREALLPQKQERSRGQLRTLLEQARVREAR